MTDTIIRQTDQSLQDLSEIFDNIFNFTSSANSAQNTIDKILDEIDNLEKSPKLGRELSKIYPDYQFNEDYRRVISGKYIVVYYLDKKIVVIARVFFGGRDYLKLLAD